jgi:hypothetical protein
MLTCTRPLLRTLTQRWLKRQRLPDDWGEQRDMIDRCE